MCQYDTLFYDNNIGYVVRCIQCRNLQVGFGNLLINLHQPDFDDFRMGVKTWHEQPPCTDNMHTKSIAMPTPCEGLKLFLSRQELNELHTMLEAADAEYQSQQLLKLFAE